MTNSSERVPSGQALVQAPSPAVSALTGFDPSRQEWHVDKSHLIVFSAGGRRAACRICRKGDHNWNLAGPCKPDGAALTAFLNSSVEAVKNAVADLDRAHSLLRAAAQGIVTEGGDANAAPGAKRLEPGPATQDAPEDAPSSTLTRGTAS